jgi:glucose dehydrogenase
MKIKCVRRASRLLVGAAAALIASQLFGGAARADSGKDWTTYGGDQANTRYSTLDLINTNNVQKLKVA